MNNAQAHAIVTEIRQKIADGSEAAGTDVERLMAAARYSGRAEHRALISPLKALVPEPAAGDDKVTDDDVKAAAEKAKRSGRVEDRVAMSRSSGGEIAAER